MNISQPTKYAVCLTAAVALLTSCGSGASSELAPAAAGQPSVIKALFNGKVFSTSVLLAKVAVHHGSVRLHTHAIKPNCCGYTKTAFISDGEANAVQMYAYPTGTYIGQLASPPEQFGNPSGMCSDRKGNVYIANLQTATIDVYSHSGAFIKALKDPDGYPGGCAINRKTGDLAVSNLYGPSSSAGGNVIVYPGGTGSPTEFNAGLYQDFFVGYVNNTSTVWVSGITRSYRAGLVALDTSNGQATPITLGGATILGPGTVAWSGKTKTMVVGDQVTLPPTFYLVDPTTYKVTSSVVMSCKVNLCDIPQATIKGSRLLGPDSVNSRANIFNFPAGGSPIASLTNLEQPIGSAISPDVPE
ncbi:MAG TPA: hypothetical protein VGF98_05490 [Candidatus Tumulicola sp.]|jgi:hypothetical protein